MVPLVILVFLNAQDAATPLPGALARAVEQALGFGTTVVVRPLTSEPTERELIAAARAQGAGAVVRLSWEDSSRLRGTLALHVLANDRRATETLAFEASDPLVERGRALGLVLAALLAPDGPEAREKQRPATSPPAPAATGPPMVVPGAIARANEPPSAPLPPRRWFLDAVADGAVAVGGAGSGWGGVVGFGRRVTSRLEWRLGLRARFGEVGDAQANILSAGLTAGLAATALRAADGERFELDLRLDALVLYEELSHFSSDDTGRVRKGRVVPGGAFLVEGRLLLAPEAAIVLGAGPELVLGRTDVFVHQTKVAELVPLRVSIHAGLRITF